MNIRVKNTFFVVTGAGKSLSKNHESGRKMAR